ncbi:MAG: hypothetical protein EOP88_13350 [Verrucomicrobiaceae bacterium]|nr:MAG: hypothetical protein EOP88_13350 [Verrucomicrobiaceae bacterium]
MSAYFTGLLRGDAALAWDHAIPQRIEGMKEKYQDEIDTEIVAACRARSVVADTTDVSNIIQIIHPGQRLATG